MAVKSFKTLIQLQRTRIDEVRVEMMRLQAVLDGIDARIAEVEIAKAREQAAAADGAARLTYGAFATGMVATGRALEKERRTAALALQAAQDRLAELFEEQKRYETAEAQRLAAIRREEARREGMELDEIGAIAHERKK